MIISGFTSTGSKRPDAMFGAGYLGDPSLPLQFTRSSGCTVWDAEDRPYTDYIMALGAVALGYAHREVTQAAVEAIQSGGVGPLPPVLEEQLAGRLHARMPWLESIRFLKTGAEAVAAAIRLARAVTGRDRVLSCGYHGWLDGWQEAGTAGVPLAVSTLHGTIPFNDSETARARIRAGVDRLACVLVEPIIEAEPTREWLMTLREETSRAGAVLVFDEIKTAFRIAVGGAVERYGVTPDLVVLGKALANGFPLSVLGGRVEVMSATARSWISSTLATEMVALAAANATLEVFVRDQVPIQLHRTGRLLLDGLQALAAAHPQVIASVGGIPEMSVVRFRDDRLGALTARAAARRGVLFKRTAYNFVSLAHGQADIARSLVALDGALGEVARG